MQIMASRRFSHFQMRKVCEINELMKFYAFFCFLFLTSRLCWTLTFFYSAAHEVSSRLHILNLNLTREETQVAPRATNINILLYWYQRIANLSKWRWAETSAVGFPSRRSDELSAKVIKVKSPFFFLPSPTMAPIILLSTGSSCCPFPSASLSKACSTIHFKKRQNRSNSQQKIKTRRYNQHKSEGARTLEPELEENLGTKKGSS